MTHCTDTQNDWKWYRNCNASKYNSCMFSTWWHMKHNYKWINTEHGRTLYQFLLFAICFNWFISIVTQHRFVMTEEIDITQFSWKVIRLSHFLPKENFVLWKGYEMGFKGVSYGFQTFSQAFRKYSNFWNLFIKRFHTFW